MRCHLKPALPARKTLAQRWALAAVLWTASPAWAACSVSATGINFGAYQPLTFAGILTSADVLSTGDVAITCSANPSPGNFTLALGPSTAGTGDRISTRYLANGSGGTNMMFNVYTDANRSVVWGNGTTGTLIAGTVPAVIAGSQTQTVTVYGKIPGGQNTLQGGTYAGAMTMTLTFSP